jgi:proteic killer suppression protein
VIRTKRDKRVDVILAGTVPKGFPPDLMRAAVKKLLMLDAAQTSESLRSPPGNRLEALAGNRAGQHSIRINQQWRICFVWQDGDAFDVEIVDYH